MANERASTGVDRKLGERVRARRLEIAMSQERLAELLGVTFQQVQKYEKGANRIAASRLLDIATALGTPVARFYEGLEAGRRGAKSEPRAQDLLARPGVAELVRVFATIESEKVRRRVVELVRAMAGDEA
ncbi:MAG: helix-turn-helix transcriptional regulator [Phycisphaerales bacterium]|nr:helix-turn-helix transcriptional regulator [Hyphomonadaceae bacterium]